jgi:hypothetical protein
MATPTNAGIRRRLGTEIRPSAALTLKHILFNQQFWAQQVTGDPDSVAAWQYMPLQIVRNLLLGVAGTGRKKFQLQTEDVSFCLPEHGAKFPLPLRVGAVFLRLAPETKSSPDKQAEIIFSSHCASGLQTLFWLT